MDPIVKLGGSGPPVLLIHGFGSDRQSWAGNVAGLMQTATVYAIDLPAHGQSVACNTDGSLDSLVQFVVSSLQRRLGNQLHLVGHSLGGAIAIQFAAQYPERVASLSLLAPAGLGSSIDSNFLSQFPMLESPDAVLGMLRSMVINQRLISRQFAPLVLHYLQQAGVRDALRDIAIELAQIDEIVSPFADVVTRRNIRRQVIWGEDDSINRPDRMKLDAFGAEMHELRNCGHLPHIEQRVGVTRLLCDFIQAR